MDLWTVLHRWPNIVHGLHIHSVQQFTRSLHLRLPLSHEWEGMYCICIVNVFVLYLSHEWEGLYCIGIVNVFVFLITCNNTGQWFQVRNSVILTTIAPMRYSIIDNYIIIIIIIIIIITFSQLQDYLDNWTMYYVIIFNLLLGFFYYANFGNIQTYYYYNIGFPLSPWSYSAHTYIHTMR